MSTSLQHRLDIPQPLIRLVPPQVVALEHKRRAHLDHAVIDALIVHVFGLAQLVKRQVRGDDQRLLAVVPSKPEVIVSV